MPNKHAAIKDLRKNRRRAAHNARLKTHVKSLYKKGMTLIKDGKKDELLALIKTFQQAVDKATKHNILSKNGANRKKSSLMKAVKKAA